MKRVIGVVGPIASGKGVAISLLQKHGYTVLSLSDVVRERTKEWGLEITRKNLQDVGDSLRKKFGSAILAEMIAPKIQTRSPRSETSGQAGSGQEKYVIDAIRNPAEVEYLQKNFNAYIIGVTADAKKRYQQMLKRGNVYDPKTWEDFVELEARDRGIGQENFGQQVEKCLTLADIVLENNGTLENFEENARYFLLKNL